MHSPADSSVAAASRRNRSARDDLVTRHLTLCRRVAKQLHRRLPRHVDVEDLEQAGMVGLIEAAKRFDASRGNAFATFAAHRVRGAMVDHIRSMDWVPRRVRERGECTVRVHSLNATAFEGDRGPRELAEYLEDKRTRSDIVDIDDRDAIDHLTRELDREARAIIFIYYARGLSDLDIAPSLGISSSLVLLRRVQSLASMRSFISRDEWQLKRLAEMRR